jgi:hypothetical protein
MGRSGRTAGGLTSKATENLDLIRLVSFFITKCDARVLFWFHFSYFTISVPFFHFGKQM